MDPRTTGVRIMEETPKKPGRVSYNNAAKQKVNPSTGRTISNSDPAAHIPLKKKPARP
jgi:hypothetical protein